MNVCLCLELELEIKLYLSASRRDAARVVALDVISSSSSFSPESPFSAAPGSVDDHTV